MKLTDEELEAAFIKSIDDSSFQAVDSISEADGIMLVCPACLKASESGRAGVHSIICWKPSVPQSVSPRPGRWNIEGTGLHDLTLFAGSSSVSIDCESKAHFFIRNGSIIDC